MGKEARQAGSSKVVREGGGAWRELLFQTGLMLARSEQGQGEAAGNPGLAQRGTQTLRLPPSSYPPRISFTLSSVLWGQLSLVPLS